jgi:DNA topoisomerase I
VKSPRRASREIDRKLVNGSQTNGHVDPGISIRMGPVEPMDIDDPDAVTSPVNGIAAAKRKSRGSLGKAKSYKEASNSEGEDDEPLVRIYTHRY